jgi:ketosteroid isomerase-like protein
LFAICRPVSATSAVFAFSATLRENAFMKRQFTLFAILVIAALSISAQSNKDSAAIRKVMDDQATAWNRGDLEAFMFGYWRSDKLVFVSGDHITRGWQQTLDNYKKSYGTSAKMGKLTFSDLEITLLSKDAAVVLGSWSLARETDNPHGKFTLLFRKFKEGWRIVMDHTS